MKRILSLFLALLLLAGVPAAHAEGAEVQAALPAEIAQFFAKSNYDGCTLGPDAYVEITDTEAGDFAFAVLTRGSSHTLYGFMRQNGRWEYWLKTDKALPQQAGEMHLRCAYGGDLYLDSATRPLSDHPTLEIGLQLAGNEEYWNWAAIYALSGAGGQWMLTYLINRLGQTCYAHMYADRIEYQNDGGEALDTVYGTIQRNLRYHSFAAFPLTPATAREKLTHAPVLPANSELTSQSVKFTGGQTFPVYSGPGVQYERAANGRAKVSTNDWIQVFGRENGYILIQYAISAEQMRFGYITETALPKNASVSSLDFVGAAAQIVADTALTDDPLNSMTGLRSLWAGTDVTYLASMGDWVYVEISGSTPVRGFVPRSALALDSVIWGEYQNDEYAARATAWQEDGKLTVSIDVFGAASWEQQPENAVTGYAVYVNNTLAAACDGPWESGYTLTFALPAGVSSAYIGLCPIRNGLAIPDEALIMNLS